MPGAVHSDSWLRRAVVTPSPSRCQALSTVTADYDVPPLRHRFRNAVHCSQWQLPRRWHLPCGLRAADHDGHLCPAASSPRPVSVRLRAAASNGLRRRAVPSAACTLRRHMWETCAATRSCAHRVAPAMKVAGAPRPPPTAYCLQGQLPVLVPPSRCGSAAIVGQAAACAATTGRHRPRCATP
jgi:hypothetical protein